MPITLITGPANAGKAGILLDGVRGHVAHASEPLLVLPTRADVDHYRRELAQTGLVFGVRVEPFDGLIAEMAQRAKLTVGSIGALARERILAGLVTGTSLRALDQSSSTPGFARALGAFISQLHGQHVVPKRLRSALLAWAGNDTKRRDYAQELAGFFEEYQRVLKRMNRTDPELRACSALDALRRDPGLWSQTPVLFYGFDDLTALQLDAIETLGSVIDAPVTVSLAYEPERLAFAGRATAFQTLLPLAKEHRSLPARADHYEPQARGALHHLERSLFELDFEKQDPSGVIRLLEGGGERAELELVAGEIKALLDRGVSPGEIAVVHRSPQTIAALLSEIFRSFEIPHALERRIAFAHTAIGRGLLGLLKSALLDGDSNDLLDWLRTPGLLERPEFADHLELKARRAGAKSAAQARALWESEHWPLSGCDHLSDAADRGPLALIAHTERALERLFCAPRKATAATLKSDELDEARALAVGRQALSELRELSRATPDLAPGAPELVAILENLQLVTGERPGPQTVAVLDPLALRARRVRALFLCGLQEGVFPAPARPEPFLTAEERRGLAQASGLRLALPKDALANERYLFYACVSRPQELLVISWHTSSDDGTPAVPSLFIDDVCDLFDADLRKGRVRRALGAADWPGPGEPVKAMASRQGILSGQGVRPDLLGPLGDEQLLRELKQRTVWSASALETWTRCPVRWFVEQMLTPGDIEPDPEPLARGALAHAALKDTLAALKLQTGSARLSMQTLDKARRLLGQALKKHSDTFSLSPNAERRAAALRRLHVDLERYLEHAAHLESPLEPQHLELSFGFSKDGELPVLDLGEEVHIRGRIDRIDVGSNAQAIIYDYKGKNVPAPEKWKENSNFQVSLYTRAAEQLLGLEPAGGFYQPLSGKDLRARGVLADDSEIDLQTVKGDRRARADLEALVNDTIACARQAATQIKTGALEPRPDTCAYQGGCRYPTICRCER